MTAREIAAFFSALELRLIQSLKRNLSRHQAWEKSEGFSWPAWQALKLREIDRFRQKNRAIVTEYARIIDPEIEAMMKEQFLEGRQQVDAEMEGLGKRGLPDDHFFGVNEPRLDSLIEDIQKSMRPAENSTLRLMDDTYRKTILQAETAMSAGAVTLPKAVDMATRDFLAQGINSIVYANGRRVNIASYAEMALRTAATRSFLRGEAKRRAQYGVDTVLVSQYGACSETCLPWQGRVYIDDVWGDFGGEVSGERGRSANGKWYPLLSVAVRGGLFHPNCRHTLTTWLEGVSRMPRPVDGEKVKAASKLEARQRAMEREIRKWKRMAEGTLDPVASEGYKRKARDAQRALREFIREYDDVLRRDPWREKTHGIPSLNDDINKTSLRSESSRTTLEKTAEPGILDEKDIYAINQYKSAKSYQINAVLRGESPMTPDIKVMVDDIDRAIEKLPTYEGVIRRSLSSDMIADLDGFNKKYTPGETVEEHAFTSASTDTYDPGMDIQMIISSKTGRDMRAYNPLEQEVLFRRGTKFKVLRKDGNTIYLEEET